MNQVHIYVIQILFVAGITYGSQGLDLDNKHKWAISIARYILYVLTIQCLRGACALVCDMFRNNRDLDTQLLRRINRHQVMIYFGSIAVLLLNDEKIINRELGLMFIASLIVSYPEVEQQSDKVTVNYGVGMACSYFEGYLVHVIPSDGAKFVGFEENINVFEARQGVVFPVKRLFIIIPKSLYSPPDLKHFNKPNSLAKLEVCRSLSGVEKDVAGVKNRIYKNSAYKIYRPEARPVCLSAECATLMHTLYRVMKNRDLYEELAHLDKEDIVADFINTLRRIIAKSPECKDKCEVIYFDDSKSNLADVLLDRIRELEPNFEELILARR